MEERRNCLRKFAARPAIGGALAALLLGNTAAADACEPGLGPEAPRVESARFVLAFKSQVPALDIGTHFALLVAACAKNGAPPEALQIDAHMPAHRHGMNYAPSVHAEETAASAKRWRVDGLLLHMPGVWEFRFDLRAGGKTDRLTYRLMLD